MGLHHTAHYLRGKGRGNDTMLVHMTPSEVKGLQAIALRHGGSLTINPDTGLPEAGFLEQILPIVAAAGLTYLTAGAAAPTLTAALGGSTMAGGIAAGALSGAAISGGMAAIQGKDVGKAALMGGLGGGISGGLGAYDAANVFNAPNLLADASQKAVTDASTQAITQGGTQAATQGGVNAAGNMVAMPSPTGSGFISGETGLPLNTGFGVTEQGKAIAAMQGGPEQRALLQSLEASQGVFPEGSAVLPGPEVTGQASLAPGFQQPSMPRLSMQDLFDQEAQNRGGAARTVGIQPETFYKGLGNYGKAGVQALPVLGLLQDEQQPGPEEEKSKLRRLSPNFRAYEPPTPNPYYSAQYPSYAAEGGIMQAYQVGGPVERMSQMNTAMNPQGGMYPQGMIDKTQYATPTQRPVSAEMVDEAPAYERSSPMLMASGGQVKGYAAGGKTMLPQFQDLFGSQPIQQSFENPRGTMSPEMQAYYAQDFANQGVKAAANAALMDSSGLLPERGTSPSQIAATQIAQPTGQSTFPGAASMQGSFGQGAQGYPSFAMGSGGSGGGSGGPFPLEGQYGIVRMNTGGAARLPKGDAGIYRDDNPTTRGQDSFTAALTRLNERQKKANIKGLPELKAAMQPLGNVESAARGGVMSSLGGYSDGGRMLKGPGDGMSDSIPASIANKQPARLADGEFVVPADVVSHLGNGSTDAGARKLYSMMDKIRKARTGKKKQAPAVKASRYMPA